MKLNTNSNIYTIVYAAVVVIIVAFLLAFASSVLSGRSNANEQNDKKKQILASLGERDVQDADVQTTYEKYIMADMIINDKGEILNEGKNKDKDGFAVARKGISKDCLPVYKCMADSIEFYVIPLVGKGLWGGIWGYMAVNGDGKTVKGVYFSHESETAGLGSLIKDDVNFQLQFNDKLLYDSTWNVVLTLKKNGLADKQSQTECDGISGATLTGNGVNNMIKEYLNLYKEFFRKNLEEKTVNQ